MIKKLVLILLVFASLLSCKEQAGNLFDDFKYVETLEVTDSILLDKYGILNPHYIYSKDSCLIFNSMRGGQEIQCLDMVTNRVRTYHVIGQGRGEMSSYGTVCCPYDSHNYKFADTRKGRIYGVDLDSLRQDSMAGYKQLCSLPVSNDIHFFRFMETEKYIVGIGILREGRFGLYEKSTYFYREQMDYPSNDEIDKLDNRYKGALYSRTLLSSDVDGKRMVSGCFGLLDFYSLSEQGELLLERSRHYHYPAFEANPQGGGAIAYKKDDVVGITGLVSNEKNIYP